MTTSDRRFVHAHILDGKGGGREIDDEEALAWKPGQGILWLHLEVGNRRGIDWLIQESGIDPLTAEAMGAGETRPRSYADEQGLLVILRGVNTNPGSDPEDMVSIRAWIESNRIITVRRRKLLSVVDIREAIAAGRGPRSPGEFLVMLAERLALRIAGAVTRIEEEVESIDDQVAEAEIIDLQRRTGQIRRQTASIRRYLAPQREALSRIRGKTTMLSPREVHDLEEQSDVMTLSLEDLDLAREQAVLISEQLTSRLANEQNSRLYVLSIVAAIFLPLSFITGLLGMNVAGLPGTEYSAAFVISVAIMIGIGAGLVGYFRWKRWI